MPNLVNAYVIYDGTTSTYVGDQNVVISINCERLQAYSPRPVWLKRFLAPGDGTTIIYEPTFAPSSIELLDANTLPGFWIEQDGKDTMIDVTTQAAFQTACDACCGTVPAIIANLYAGAAPAFTPLTLNSFCIFRLDDGSTQAHGQIALDYLTNIFAGSGVKMTSHITGVSHYSVTSYYTTLSALPGDVITNGACSS
jgi:hypothetical protein